MLVKVRDLFYDGQRPTVSVIATIPAHEERMESDFP